MVHTPEWKQMKDITDCPVKNSADGQINKLMDYKEKYVKYVLDGDEIKDWPSIEGCKNFYHFCLDKIGKPDTSKWRVLDCGTKDGQFPEYLQDKVKKVTGIEISKPYIEYAKSKNRPVVFGDVCKLRYKNKTFDFVFSHHLLGLTPNYYKGLCEMFRVLKPGGYMVTLDNIPGNMLKHFSYIEGKHVIDNWLETEKLKSHKMIYYDYWANNKELAIVMEKL